MIIAIDPSVRSTGVALLKGGTLLRAERVLCKGGEPIAMGSAVLDAVWRFLKEGTPYSCYPASEIVVEYPQPFANQKPRVGDLIKLSATAGAIGGMLAHQHACKVRWVLPSEWKAQIPKPKTVAGRYIVEHRARALLSPAELDSVELPRNVRQQWDVWDAIGLGLFATGRCRCGVKP